MPPSLVEVPFMHLVDMRHRNNPNEENLCLSNCYPLHP
jgi:hypothetical protein